MVLFRSLSKFESIGVIIGILNAIGISAYSYTSSNVFRSLGLTDERIGIMYIIISILAVGLLLSARKFRGSPITLLRIVIGSQMILALGIILASHIAIHSNLRSAIVSICVVLVVALESCVYTAVDRILERATHAHHTGVVRGSYLAFSNIAWMFGVFFGALLGYYFETATLSYAFIPVILSSSMVLILSEFIHLRFSTIHIPHTLTALVSFPRNLFHVYARQALLYIFFSVMIVFLPLLLRIHHINAIQTGLILFIMISAFPLMQVPLRTVIEKLQKKTLRSLSYFSLLCMIVALVYLINLEFPAPWYLLALTLFLSRIGASVFEEITDFMLFREITDTSVSAITTYRLLGPVMYIGAGVFALCFTNALMQPFVMLILVLWVYLLISLIFKRLLIG